MASSANIVKCSVTKSVSYEDGFGLGLRAGLVYVAHGLQLALSSVIKTIFVIKEADHCTDET